MKEIFNKDFFRIFLKYILIFGIIGIIITGIILYFMALHSDGIDYDSLGIKFSSMIYAYDENGEEVAFEQINGGQNRLWCDIENMPKHLQQAFVAIEDERFYSHSGIDFKRTLKATLNYLIKRDSSFGGSTINQQLVKNITGYEDRSPRRKVIEMIRAFDMDRKLSKDQILELYLNTIYLSQGCNGVKTAADKYFGKEVSELTLAECASIAGITQYPTKYDPILNPENNNAKKELILKKMLELKMISKEEYDEAMAEKLNFANNDVSDGGNHMSYYTDMLVDIVIEDLMEELSISETIAKRMLYSGGLKIYSTIDPKIQNAAEEVFSNPKKYIPYNENAPIQGAMVVIDHSNGHVKAVVGGLGKQTASRTLNRAVKTFRQPGSTIKPLSVYGPGFEYGKFTPDTIFVDEKVTIGSHSIKNYYEGFRGPVSVRYAVQQSINTVAVSALEKVGLNRSYNFMTENLGFTSLTPSDMDFSPLALGGLTKGVSVLEMTSAYSVIANNGKYYKPLTYTKIEDQDGKIILEKEEESRKAMTPFAADTMLSCLRSVVSAGTGGQASLSNMPVAGKTGTTDDDKDRWFMGITPYYTGGVWVGYDIPKQITGFGTNPAIVLWKAVMSKAHENLDRREFVLEKGIVQKDDTAKETQLVEVCMDSGMLATSLCQENYSGSRVEAKDLSEEEIPTDACSLHQYVEIDMSTGQLANNNCPMSLIETRVQILDGSETYCTAH